MPDLATIDARLTDLAAMYGAHQPGGSAVALDIWTTRVDLLLDERLKVTRG